MSLKWKTTLSYFNLNGPLPDKRAEIESHCAQWQAQGLYSGGLSSGGVPDTPNSVQYHRWWWTTEEAANQYVEMVNFEFNDPTLQCSVLIESEEVPD